MNGVVMGAAIVALTALKAGPALWALTGRSWNRGLAIAWPLVLWLVALGLLFTLVPASPLLEGEPTQPVLVAACVAASLVYALPLLRAGWHLWSDSRA